MTYNPYNIRIVVKRGERGCYNVWEEQKGKSPRKLASFPTKEQAEHYKRVRRP